MVNAGRKWRPAPLNCLYVVSNLNGGFQELCLMFDRMLPLRKSDGGKDRLVILGKYFDSVDSHKLLDRLIKEKNKDPSKITLLKTEKEDAFLKGIEYTNNSEDYLKWMKAGGEKTLSGYLQLAKHENKNPYTFPRQRIKDVISSDHIEFIKSMQDSHIFGGYCFGERVDGLTYVDDSNGIKISPEEISLQYKKPLITEILSLDAFSATAGHQRMVNVDLAAIVSDK